jgi:hypothetical protein
MLTGIAVVASLALTASFIAADPALAVDVSSSSLTWTAGHTCYDLSGGESYAVVCVELGIYTSSNGQAHITAQTEVDCSGASCYAAQVNASVESTTYSPTPSMVMCGIIPNYAPPPCIVGSTGRTYEFPFNGINISYGGGCVDNVWAVVFVTGSGPDSATYVQPAPNTPGGESGTPYTFPAGHANLGTAHYDVCEGAEGTFTFTK